MHRSTHPLPIVIGAAVLGLAASTLSAQSRAPQRVNACTLLTQAEVKQHLPWRAAFDSLPQREEAIGTEGSSCTFPSVEIQVLPPTSRIIEIAKERGKLEQIGGIGNEAYFYVNPVGYAEIYVRTGTHVLTLQADSASGIDTVKPGVLSLARALVGKL
jgi:hypothetical protein